GARDWWVYQLADRFLRGALGKALIPLSITTCFLRKVRLLTCRDEFSGKPYSTSVPMAQNKLNFPAGAQFQTEKGDTSLFEVSQLPLFRACRKFGPPTNCAQKVIRCIDSQIRVFNQNDH